MKIFLDANILVSFLNKEYPFFTSALKIFSLQDMKRIELLTSPVCLAIAFYFSEKKYGTEKASKKIRLLATKLKFTRVDDQIIRELINDTSILDIEDGIQYFSALEYNCQYIITEDSGFYSSKIPVLNSNTFLQILFN